MRFVDEKYRRYFEENLAKLNDEYDQEWKCPGDYKGDPGYHSNLHHCRVHSTVQAFSYANMLLATGREEDLQRAVEVLRHAAALQDKDPANATYGIWSWFMEEPLEKMSPPDWNWADFCGKHILQVFYYHAERMPADLLDELRETLRCACMSIFRRNMHPGYTNISIMGCYVTLAAGQYFGWQDMFDYGVSRLEKAWDYTLKNGTFAEYNSATYTTVAIEELTRIYQQITDAHVHSMIGDMLDVAWRTVAEHFHAPTRQWTGPNSRSYTWLTTNETLSFLRVALDNGEELVSDADFVYSNDLAYIDVQCPEKYRRAFSQCEAHDVNIGFTRGSSIRDPRTHIAIAHLTPDYTLSSWEQESTWNQCRNLIGYWGGSKPRFIDATILHDLYDFSSGMFVTAQSGGNALIAGSLKTNGGDTHCNIDMIQDETIKAYDLRMRIELGGALEKPPVQDGNMVTLEDGGVKIRITLLDAQWNGQPCRLELRDSLWDEAQQSANLSLYRRVPAVQGQASSPNMRYYVDVVFYHGEYREIKLSDIQTAYAALCVSMENEAPQAVEITRAAGYLHAQATMAGVRLHTCSPDAPVARDEWHGWAAINGVPMRQTYGLPLETHGCVTE